MIDKKLLFILIIIGIIGALSNGLEHQLRQKEPTNVYKLYKGKAFDSVDNEYYLSYAYNFLEGKGWRLTMATNQSKNEPVGKGSYFRRVPGYSLVYVTFIGLFGDSWGLSLLLVFQYILFLLSVYCTYKILDYWNTSNFTKITITLLYGVIPYFYSWTFYTLTESITPFLVVFYLYFLVKAYQCKNTYKITYYSIATFFVTYGTLTRPYIAIAFLAIPIFLWNDYKNIGLFIKKAVLISVVPILMVGTWAIRNYYLTGEFVLLEKAHHPESLDRMKPEFEGFWNFVKCWEIDGGGFNGYQIPLFYNTLRGDTTDTQIKHIVEKIPKKVMDLYKPNEVYNVLKKYQRVIYAQKDYFKNNIAMPSQYSAMQLEVKNEFDALTKKYKEKYPLDYYIVTPFKYLKSIVLHSNTAHIYYFQEQFRHNQLLNIIRYGLVVFHILLYLAIPINFFLQRKSKEIVVTAIIPVIFIIFLIFFFQAVEQRYMLPFLPFLFIGLYPFLEKITKKYQKNDHT